MTGVRYKWYLPTIRFLYPDSYIEANKVVKQIETRTQEDIDFFTLTDNSVIYAFRDIVPNIELEYLRKIANSQDKKIILLKNFINRPRPYQMSSRILPLRSTTAHTPAFPAGHAAQAYILANYLQKKYPHKKKIFEKIADKCNDCRIKAGLHYPSDGIYSKMIFYG
tara:strand:+ start:188 stop:685 length:498 start_codon:yes stop_codon:yes gene_type:complete